MNKAKVKIALSTPKIKLCAPMENSMALALSAKEADGQGADIILFPELSLTGATAYDLFLQDRLIEESERALLDYIDRTKELTVMSFVGLPIRIASGTYNAVAVISEGEILGVTLSGLSEKPFSSYTGRPVTITLAGQSVTASRDNIYTDEDTRANIFVKIGEDPAFVSEGANIILNPTAMTEYVGLSRKRLEYAREISRELGIAFVMVGAGEGESTTDGVFAAPKLYANGDVSRDFSLFTDTTDYIEISPTSAKATFARKKEQGALEPPVSPFPFVPEDKEELALACETAILLQAKGLSARIERAYAKTLVIGVSGGLDSTMAVLAAARAMDLIGKDRKNIIAVTMPCFGTTERTKSNALNLAEELGASLRTIDIKAAVTQHFKDISHDEKLYDVVYENAQARERTKILMDIANKESGLVVGTGDLSELALGFATYSGDHMSMYSVNGSIPKTFMRAIIRHEADKAKKDGALRLANALYDIIDTPVSPELLPLDADGENSQHTEKIVGPYELHDFFLYYTVKYGYSPSKILSLAKNAHKGYSEEEIKGYLEIFVKRFFSQQFKRSCMPDGPRVTEISLSPRGAWRMPSDVSSEIWRSDLK